MFGISKLTSAVRILTENVLALAATVRDVNTGLCSRLALDAEGDGPRPSTSSRKPCRPGNAARARAPTGGGNWRKRRPHRKRRPSHKQFRERVR